MARLLVFIFSECIVASSGDNSDGVKQGFIQMLGIYVTTLIVCTATAIILLSSDYLGYSLFDVNGIELASNAFSYHFGSIGIYILIFSVVLFSFSTIVTGYYYGEASLNYFFRNCNVIYIYLLRGITLLILFIGCVLPSSLLWGVVDILVGLVVLVNLYSLWMLRDKVN